MARQPLYLQIKEWLAQSIKNGELAPGDQIPSEIELSKRFSTTRDTVRKAIEELVNENMLVRVGRKGTFVSKAPWERHLHRFQTCYEDLVQRGLKPVTRVLTTEIVVPPREHARTLQLQPGEQVARIVRLRSVDGEPFVLMEDWLPLDLYRPLLGEDLSRGSLYHLLERKAGCRIGSGTQTLGVAQLTPRQAKLLGVPPTASALEMCVVVYSTLGEPFLVGRYLFRGDRYRLTVTLRR